MTFNCYQSFLGDEWGDINVSRGTDAAKKLWLVAMERVITNHFLEAREVFIGVDFSGDVT